MLSIIGLGLCDGTDITLRGKKAVDAASQVYLEGYTSLLRCSHEELEHTLGKKIVLLSREDVERGIERVLEEAKNKPVALLVIGDPFGATTHADLMLRAREHDVSVEIIHNASILTAVGAVGLSLYKYGTTVSIPFWEKGFEPTSFVDGIAQNLERGLHTLCLLDIKADESRWMSVAQGAKLLLQASERIDSTLSGETRAIGVARIGWPEQKVIVGTLESLSSVDFGPSPHAIVILGVCNVVEEEMLATWDKSTT